LEPSGCKDNSTKPEADKLRVRRNCGGTLPMRARRAPLDGSQIIDLMNLFAVKKSLWKLGWGGVWGATSHNLRLEGVGRFPTPGPRLLPKTLKKLPISCAKRQCNPHMTLLTRGYKIYAGAN